MLYFHVCRDLRTTPVIFPHCVGKADALRDGSDGMFSDQQACSQAFAGRYQPGGRVGRTFAI
jgi:hypothetical protein